jgi:hypothetical protein
VSQESKLNIDEEEYVKSFSPDLMEVAFAWCQVPNTFFTLAYYAGTYHLSIN